MKILEGPFYVKLLGTSDRDTLLWLDVGGTTYIYDRAPNADPIKEIARKFEKMMQYGPGRALAWLKKNTVMRGKVPTSQAKGRMKESNKKPTFVEATQAVRESEGKDVAVGDTLNWNSREWKVVGVRSGRYLLTSAGLPQQSVAYLQLNQWVDQGKAKLLNRAAEAIQELTQTDIDRTADINQVLNQIASRYHIDAYKLSNAMETARPVTVDAARAVITKVAGDYVAHSVSFSTLDDLVYLYAQDELLTPEGPRSSDDADVAGGFEDSDDEARIAPDNSGYF